MTVTTRTMAFLFGLLFIAATLLPLVLAVPSPPTSLDVLESSRRNLSLLANDPIDAQAGNITGLNITALAITKNWQGYYGNVSGTILLADAQNNTLYEWNHYPPVGEIYATRKNTIEWTSINCSNATDIAAEETYLGHSPTVPDSVTNTFTATNHPSFYTGNINISGCPTTNTFVDNVSQSSDFYSVLLTDANNVTAYVGIIDFNKTGYDSKNHDFQMLVGENGHPGHESVTPYYFYVELGA